VHTRPAAVADVDAIVAVLAANGEDDLTAPYVEHLLATGHVVVAEADGSVVGIAATVTRGGVIHVADLFVAPPWHGRGAGRELLGHLLPGDRPTTTFASSDPRALPLYVRAGMTPWWPLLFFQGRPRRALPAPFTVERATVAEVAAVDTAATGVPRDGDHAFLAARPGSRPVVVRDGARAVACGHLRAGFLDVLQVVDEIDAVGAVLSALDAVLDATIGAVGLAVPGPHPAVVALLEAGLPITGTDTFCATGEHLFDPVRRLPHPGLG